MNALRQLPDRVRQEPNARIPMADGVRPAARIWRFVCDHPVAAIPDYIAYRKRFGTAEHDQGTHGYLAVLEQRSDQSLAAACEAGLARLEPLIRIQGGRRAAANRAGGACRSRGPCSRAGPPRP